MVDEELRWWQRRAFGGGDDKLATVMSFGDEQALVNKLEQVVWLKRELWEKEDLEQRDWEFEIQEWKRDEIFVKKRESERHEEETQSDLDHWNKFNQWSKILDSNPLATLSTNEKLEEFLFSFFIYRFNFGQDVRGEGRKIWRKDIILAKVFFFFFADIMN